MLGDGSQLGINLSYATQPKPEGLAQAFLIGEEFIGQDSVALVLGDNIFHGHGFGDSLKECVDKPGATIFAYPVSDPERYGVVAFDESHQATSIEEKPQKPKSNYAVVGLYFYDNQVVEIAKSIEPSDRGELEITTINEHYLQAGKLAVQIMDRGSAWLDTGTFDSMMAAAQYVEVIEQRTGYKIGCIEEVAYREGFIDKAQLLQMAESQRKSGYGLYLEAIAHEKS